VAETIERTATELVAQLNARLAQYEDAETAISVYKMANWLINRLAEVKEAALDLAEHDMRDRSLDALQTPVGSAGWTEPKATQLDEEAWREALSADRRLLEIQRAYDQAQGALEQAQGPYCELPESRFFIR
jgi:hypothetical protein